MVKNRDNTVSWCNKINIIYSIILCNILWLWVRILPQEIVLYMYNILILIYEKLHFTDSSQGT